MKFLIDAQLPSAIADYFPGHDVIHTSSLIDGNNTKDHVINNFSIAEERILITKDSDFYYSYLSPYKLLLVSLGNMRISHLKTY